jgi:hypothetical protein
MKEVDPKDIPEISGGEVMSTPPVLDVSYPMLKLPDPGQPNKALILPEQPLP